MNSCRVYVASFSIFHDCTAAKDESLRPGRLRDDRYTALTNFKKKKSGKVIAWKSDCIWQLYFHVLSSAHQQNPVHSLIYLFRAPFCVITNAAVEYILTLSQKHIYNIPCQEVDDDRAYQDKVMTSSLAGPRMDTYPSQSIFWLCLATFQRALAACSRRDSSQQDAEMMKPVLFLDATSFFFLFFF